MYLFERQGKILEYLKKQNDFVTGATIAKHFKISDRTVRNEINAIKKLCGEDIIVAVRTKGYQYNFDYEKPPSSTYYTLDIVSPNDRLLYILKNLIVSHGLIDIFDLAEQLFLSERSIETDVSRMNKILLELDLKNINIMRTDTQIQLKNAYTISNNILYDIAKYNNSDIGYSDFQKIFTNINMDYLGYLVIEILNEHKHISRYLSCTRFIIDIAMFIEAINYHKHHLGDFYQDLIQPFQANITPYYHNIAKDIKDMVLEHFGTTLSDSDIQYINHILYINHQMQILEDDIAKSYGEKDEFYIFCLDMFHILKTEKGIHFIEDETLINDLILHLKIAMKRIELGIKLYNPLIDNVTTKYMHLLDIAIMIADMIEDKYHICFTFNEISYIGIYLATALHTFFDKVDFNSKLKLLLYIPEGIGNLTLIHRQIEKIIDKNKVMIDGITNLSSTGEFNQVVFDYSLIITTSKRFNQNAQNVFVLKKSFDIHYQNEIKEMIQKELIKLEQNKIKTLIRSFTKETLFLPQVQLKSKEAVLLHLSHLLHQEQVVDASFAQSVFEREEIAPTDLETGIAFPHSLKNTASHSMMAIALLKEPILWNSKKVKVVCMYANAVETTSDSNYFVQHFMEAVFSPSFAEDIYKCTNYEACVSTFATYFS